MEKEVTKVFNVPKEKAETITRTQEIIRNIIIIIIRIIEENITTTESRGMGTEQEMNDPAVIAATIDIPSRLVGRNVCI